MENTAKISSPDTQPHTKQLLSREAGSKHSAVGGINTTQGQ